MLELALLAFMVALAVALAVGARVVVAAPRTPTAPERWIGFSILMLALGAILEATCRHVAGSPELARSFDAIYRSLYTLSAAVLYLGVWRTFRPESRGGLALVLLGSIATATWAVRLVLGWSVEDVRSASWLASELARVGPFAWAAFESFRYASRVRRRQRFGLGDPLTASRFRLWGIASTVVTILLSMTILVKGALGIEVLEWPPTLIAASLLALGASLSFHGAYFPHAVYRRWLEGDLRIAELADRLLPDTVRTGDAERLRRARLILVAAATSLLWVPPVSVYLRSADAFQLSNVLLLLGAIIAASPLVLRATGSVVLAANLVLIGLALFVMNAVLAGSGVYSSTLPWLMLMPAGGFLLAGSRAGLGWTVAALAGVWWAYFAGAPAGAGPSGFSGSHPVIRAINLSAVLTIFTAVALSFVRQQERAVREVRLASEAKSRFLAAMSHEIRTPLNGVLGMAQLLLETNPTSRQRELAETIRSSGETLLTLLNDILDLSRIEAGRVQIAQVDFDPRELLAEVERIVTRSAQEKGLALSFSVAPDLPEALKGDPDRLHQVLLNLISNAIKFTDRGGVDVRLLTQSRRGPDGVQMVRLEVTDTGVGIRPEDQEHIFERFSQVDQSSTRRHGGAGLGLAILKELAEKMDGEVGVESRPGEGSRFWFILPLLTGDPLAARSRESAEGEGPEPPADPLRREPEARTAAKAETPGAAGRILLVEDNPVNRSVAAGMLEALGHQVDVADDGGEGVRSVSLNRYDVILMDCQMPEMDGFEATREIRRLERRRPEPFHVPVIALTAAAFSKDRERCLEAGMDDYLPKPFKLEELAEVLARWLPGNGPEPAEPSEPARAAAPGKSVLDPGRLDEIRTLQAEAGDDLLARVVGAYLDSAPGLVEGIETAIRKGDASALADAAHPLKSSSASLGVMRLSELCKELEALGRAGSIDGASELLGELRLEFARVQSALERHAEETD
jgi:signal transduction histidine kinase/DNA-binding NarL/FixJ family response regulator/HPt (histidine-containing phosphotransfer) domain-containing protein